MSEGIKDTLFDRIQENLDHVARLDSQFEQLQARLENDRENNVGDPLELDLIEAKMRVSRIEIAKAKRGLKLAEELLREE